MRLDAVSACDMEGVGDLAIDIQLKLRMRSIANANRAAALIAGEPRDLALGELALSSQAVHDLQLRRLPRDGAQQPLSPGLSFFQKTGNQQGV